MEAVGRLPLLAPRVSKVIRVPKEIKGFKETKVYKAFKETRERRA
jgi:hypothetical protein